MLLSRAGTPLGGGWFAAVAGEQFAGAQQIADLKQILPELGFDYDTADGTGSYQDTCPHCRRASVALAQSARVGGFG